MGKLYEALKRTEDQQASSILEGLETRALEENGTGVPKESPAPQSKEQEEAPSRAAVPIRPRPEPDACRSVALRLRAGSPLLPFDGSDPGAAEQYRLLRTRLLQRAGQKHRVIALSSAGPADGKTVSAINLSAALALKNDLTVLLIDADLRRSSIAPALGLSASPGLADVLSGACRLEDAALRIEQLPNLYVLPAGTPGANPAELLDSESWRSLAAQLRRQFQFVLIDTPPIAAVADFDLILSACDGLIFIVRPGHTNRMMCLNTLSALPREKLLGVVINDQQEWFAWKTGSYYYSGGEKPALPNLRE